jgi:hypothetical protein
MNVENLGASLDPAVGLTLRAGLAGLFLWAAAHKLRDLAAFRRAVAAYALLPPRVVAAASLLLAGAEVLIGLGLLHPASDAQAALAAAAVLVLYSGAIGINLLHGRRDIDCGCAGPARSQPLTPGLVARNGALIAAALGAALPAAARPLVWLDGMTVAGCVAAGALLSTAAGEALAAAPRLAALRRGGAHRGPTGSPHASALVARAPARASDGAHRGHR